MAESEPYQLSEEQKARIERNKLKARHLRQAKLVSQGPSGRNTVKIQNTKLLDSGGGFFFEEAPGKSQTPGAPTPNSEQANEAIAIPVTYEQCSDCGEKFVESFLFAKFVYSICDRCHDPDEKHALITKTEAKQEYLLKDCDLEKREPPLKFITRKNPHHVRWGEMKLYLRLQVEKRALEVWQSKEEIVKQHEEREEQRHVAKIKKYNKNMKTLKMEMRSSLFNKTVPASHTHSYGPETYNEEDDTYTHVCVECKFSETFEKM